MKALHGIAAELEAFGDWGSITATHADVARGSAVRARLFG